MASNERVRDHRRIVLFLGLWSHYLTGMRDRALLDRWLQECDVSGTPVRAVLDRNGCTILDCNVGMSMYIPLE